MWLNDRFDTPLRLYDNPDSVFYSLCQKSGISREDVVTAAKESNNEITIPDISTVESTL